MKTKSIMNINEFEDLFGIWSEKEKKEFDENICDFREIETSEWE